MNPPFLKNNVWVGSLLNEEKDATTWCFLLSMHVSFLFFFSKPFILKPLNLFKNPQRLSIFWLFNHSYMRIFCPKNSLFGFFFFFLKSHLFDPHAKMLWKSSLPPFPMQQPFENPFFLLFQSSLFFSLPLPFKFW